MPSFGGPPDASVLANAHERGPGAGVRGDRLGALWDLDVALAMGERIATCGDRHVAAAASHLRPAGPLLDGLFSQFGFGVVLSGRIALQPTMPYAASFLAEIGSAEALPPVLARLARLLDAGLVAPSAAALWNGAKRRASLARRHGVDAAIIGANRRAYARASARRRARYRGGARRSPHAQRVCLATRSKRSPANSAP